jgi:hypothetical protein
MADSMAGLLLGLPKQHGAWSLATDGSVEAFHIHGVTDASIHAVLFSERAKEVLDTGWRELHAYADFDTQIMLYAPRNEEEIDIVVGLLRESIEFVKSSLVNAGAAGR